MVVIDGDADHHDIGGEGEDDHGISANSKSADSNSEVIDVVMITKSR